MICGYQLPSPLNARDPDWDPESGLGLAQYIERQKKNPRSSGNNFSYYLYYLVLNFSSDLCAAYLGYSADLTQILRTLAAPKQLVAATTFHFCPPLPVACCSSREMVALPWRPLMLVTPSHPCPIRSVRPIQPLASQFIPLYYLAHRKPISLSKLDQTYTIQRLL